MSGQQVRFPVQGVRDKEERKGGGRGGGRARLHVSVSGEETVGTGLYFFRPDGTFHPN